jgi:hypothetical protein
MRPYFLASESNWLHIDGVNNDMFDRGEGVVEEVDSGFLSILDS